jgi:hypothetical protein
MRGNLKFQEDVERFFTHIEPDKKERTGWRLVPFVDIIKESPKYHASKLPRGVKVTINSWSAYWDYFQIDPKKGFGILKAWKNRGKPIRALQTAQPDENKAYQDTLCCQFVNERYRTNQKRANDINTMGLKLYIAYNNRDPAYFTSEQFKEFIFKPFNLNPDGSRKFQSVSQTRCVMDSILMALAGKHKELDLPLKNFRFVKGDVFDTTGLKNIGGKREDYLHQEPANEQLKAFVQNITELDTLVLHRIALEGGGRISASSNLMRKNIFPMEQKALFLEPKMKHRSKGYMVYKYFCKSTLEMLQDYIKDAGKTVSDFVFHRHENVDKNQNSFNNSFLEAGLRAGLWRWRHDTDPNAPSSLKFGSNDFKVYVEKSETLRDVLTGQPYHRLFYVTVGTLHGKEVKHKNYLYEGLKTSSHVVGKHTFVSLSGQHGFSLEDIGEQVGTDTGTLELYYRGGGSQKLQSMVGIVTQDFIPWKDWINGWIDELYRKQYKKLKAEGKITLSGDVLEKEAVQDIRFVEED